MDDYSYRDFLVLSPQHIDYKRLLDEVSINENIPKAFIGTIIKFTALKMQFNKESKLDTFDYAVPLCSKKLQGLYGNDYKIAVKLLISNYVFRYPYSESNCFKYALNDVSRSYNLDVIKLETKTTKGRGIVQRLKKDSKSLSSKAKRKFKFMLNFFDNKRLSIDLNNSLKLIEEEYSLNRNYPRYLNEFQKIINIHNGDYSFHYKPETDGRFHNSFTFLNKKFRKYLTYDNKRLVEIDISNSIPTIFSLLLSNSINLNFKEVLNNNIYKYLLMFNKTSTYVDNKEIELFKEYSVSGKLYEMIGSEFIRKNFSYLIDKYDGYYDGNEYMFTEELDTRKITKHSLLSMFFSKNGTYIQMELAFESLFPTIFRFIKRLKKENSYKLFAHLLFQVESQIILEQVARPFNRVNRGKIPLFTIHDCICIVEGNEDALHDFMKDRFVELFGVNIGLKFKKI